MKEKPIIFPNKKALNKRINEHVKPMLKETREQAIRDTITSKDKFGLISIKGQEYKIIDIGMRMLEPHELFAAQGFPSDYIIDRDFEGNPYPKTAQVARCGNAVCPPIPAALVRANFPEL